MKLLAVDGNSIINRAYYGIRLLSTKEGIFTNGIVGFMNILLKIQGEVEPNAVAVAFDMKGPTFRHDMFDKYKAGRTGMPDELAMQMPLLQELLQDLGYSILKKEGYEADDILGTLAHSSREKGYECVIATGDRDSFQLVGDGVSVRLAYTKGGQTQEDIVDEDFVIEKYGVTPKQLIEVKGLMGDPSDNIPGVKGIGEKTALDLIQRYGSIDYIYENFEEVDLKPAQRRNLEAEKEIAYMSRKLGIIDCCVPIDTDIKTYALEKPNNAKAYAMMTKLELFALMERIGIRPPEAGELTEDQTMEEELQITFGDYPKELLTGNDLLDVLFDISEDYKVSGICIVSGGNLYYLDKDVEKHGREILTSSAPKRTNHIKPLWHWAMGEGFSIENVVFDAEIAGYILNPNSPDYNLDRLYGEYGIIPNTLEESQEEKFPLLKDAIGFTLLCEALSSEIEKNGQQELLRDMELPLAMVLADMERIGIAVDRQGIEDFGVKISATLAEAEQRIYAHAGEGFNVNSPKQLSEILFNPDKLGLPPQKKTKTGYSTNVDVLEALKDKHPIIHDILEYRQLAKLNSTYVVGLLAVISPDDGRIHTTFQQTLTRTGRISSTEPNLQNIPIRTPLGSELRRFFVAKEGTVFIDADYSQIELRVLAHLSQDENMMGAFRDDKDIHTITASQVFDMPLPMVTPLMRSRAKAVNFGIVYGIGAFSLAQDIGVSVSEADDYIKGYLRVYSGVDKYMEKVIEEGTENGYVTTLFGRRRYLPELAASNYNTREFGKRVARNMPIQGTAADIIKIAMVRVHHRLIAENLKARMVLQVHDELIIECPPEEVAKASKILQEEMESAVELLVPLEAEVKTGANWLEVL